MPITTVKRPYEMLIRWKDGALSGAHVGFELTAFEDGVALSTTPLPVVAVDIGQGLGFPLADILGQVHVGAISSMDAANVKCAAAEAKAADLEMKVAELESTIATLSAQA